MAEVQNTLTITVKHIFNLTVTSIYSNSAHTAVYNITSNNRYIERATVEIIYRILMKDNYYIG